MTGFEVIVVMLLGFMWGTASGVALAEKPLPHYTVTYASPVENSTH